MRCYDNQRNLNMNWVSENIKGFLLIWVCVTMALTVTF